MPHSRLRTFGIWALLVAVALVAFLMLQEDPLPVEPWQTFQEDAAAHEVAVYEWTDQGFYAITTRGGDRYQASGVVDTELAEALAADGVYPSYDVGWIGLLGGVFVPLVAIVGVLALVFLVLRRVQGKAAGQALDLRKSKARLLDTPPATRFTDVGGCEEAKERLHDVVDFLQHPEVWAQAGARVPRGVLLEGPPGSGKTLLARAVAGEAGVRFFVVSGSEFVEMFVGVGAARVRDLFENATKAAPAVIFIDELDAIGRRRGSGIGHWNEEREQTLNQILVSLDGFETRERVVVIGATNRSDILDPALVRPGRFDLRLRIPPLEEGSRGQVLGIHARGKKLAPEVDLAVWALRTQGATGAGLEQLLNEAALLAVRRRAERAGIVLIQEADLADAWANMQRQGEGFLPLDQALVDSAWQLARSDGQQRAALRLADGRELEGALLWADGVYMKLRQDDGSELAVAKSQVVSVRAPPPAPDGA